ncbi:hypothetical protein LIA77_11981 [Sarocladium implicatum]|nr:hypothetical protein LIA77_11981 [Sarocladium implicatum]
MLRTHVPVRIILTGKAFLTTTKETRELPYICLRRSQPHSSMRLHVPLQVPLAIFQLTAVRTFQFRIVPCRVLPEHTSDRTVFGILQHTDTQLVHSSTVYH